MTTSNTNNDNAYQPDKLTFLKSQTKDWNLSHDYQIATLLSQVSLNFQNRITSVSRTIEKLEHDFSCVEASVRSTCNELSLRGDVQFLEHCVEDDNLEADDEIDMTNTTIDEEREVPEDKMLDSVIPNGMKALSIFLDPADIVTKGYSSIEDSCYYYDSVQEDEFNHRPLPFVVGTVEFRNSSFAGLAEEKIAATAVDHLEKEIGTIDAIAENNLSSSDSYSSLPTSDVANQLSDMLTTAIPSDKENAISFNKENVSVETVFCQSTEESMQTTGTKDDLTLHGESSSVDKSDSDTLTPDELQEKGKNDSTEDATKVNN